MKTKYEKTRKQKAIRRTTFLLAVLLFAIFVVRYGFFPSSSIRSAEEEYGTGRTNTIIRIFPSPSMIGALGIITVSENENVIIMCTSIYNLLTGWTRYTSSAIDCSAPGDICTGYHTYYRENNSRYSYYYGKLANESIQKVEIYAVNIEAPDSPLYIGSSSSFKEKDGNRYFVVKSEENDISYEYSRRYAAAYNAEGDTVFYGEIAFGTSTIAG